MGISHRLPLYTSTGGTDFILYGGGSSSSSSGGGGREREEEGCVCV